MADLTLVTFRYTNYKGETAVRRVRPIRLWFGSTGWHPEAQWLLEAFDLDRGETRDFALRDITGWRRLMDGPPGPGIADGVSGRAPVEVILQGTDRSQEIDGTHV